MKEGKVMPYYKYVLQSITSKKKEGEKHFAHFMDKYIAKKCKNHEFLCKNAYLCDKNEHNE